MKVLDLLGISLPVFTGILTTTLLLLAGLYSARRRAMGWATRRKLGSARAWLWLHLAAGTLFLLLLLWHSGFALPSGGLSWALWLLAVWTVLSGLVGLALQRWLPVALAGLPVEAPYERIPELVEDLRRRAARLASRCGGPVQALYSRRVAPALEAPRRDASFFLDISGGSAARLREADYLVELLNDDDRARLSELERIYRAKLALDAHYTLQWALRGWLLLHVPPTVVLMVLVLIHIAAVLYY